MGTRNYKYGRPYYQDPVVFGSAIIETESADTTLGVPAKDNI